MIALVLQYWKPLAIAVAGLALLAAAATYRQSLINEGYDRALRQMERENAQASETARRLRRSVDVCFDAGRVWDTVAGQCRD